MAAYEKQQQQQPEAPLNPTYYGRPMPPPQPAYYYPPPPPPAPRRSGCARCLIGSLVALGVTLGVAVLVLWLIFRPDNLKAYADSAALSRFDLGNNGTGTGNGGGDLLQFNLTVVIRVRNPNRFGIRYDYAEARAFYDGDRFGSDQLQPFYVDSKSDATITATFDGSTVVNDDDARRTYRRENGEGFYSVKVRVDSDLSFRVRIIRRHDFKSKITCVLQLPVPAAGGNVSATPMTTLGKRCDVDF